MGASPVQLASALVGLTEELLDSDVESDDQFTGEYYEPARDEHLTFDDLFRVHLDNVAPDDATTGFKDWLTNALEEGTYKIG